MLKSKTILAIISARGGSKGVPRKNIRKMAGKPLIAWTIETAKQSKYLDRVILSSEDSEIINVARKWGCEVPFVRPAELAQDDTSGIEPVIHAVNTLPEQYDYVMLLQPTSPLRNAADIDGCIKLCIDEAAAACVSLTEASQSPYWMYTLNENKSILPLIETKEKFDRRQNLPKVYALNGALYIARRDWLLYHKTFITDETLAFIIPEQRSIDLDNEIDFEFAEFLLKKNMVNKDRCSMLMKRSEMYNEKLLF